MAAISSYLVTAPSKKYCFRKHFKKNVFIDIFIIKSWNFHPDLVNGALWIQDEYLNNPGWIACIDKRCLIDQFKSFPMLPMVPMPLEKRWVGASDQEMKHRHILKDGGQLFEDLHSASRRQMGQLGNGQWLLQLAGVVHAQRAWSF